MLKITGRDCWRLTECISCQKQSVDGIPNADGYFQWLEEHINDLCL